MIRKLWSKNNFKSVVSPQELIQEITVASSRRFVIGQQAEAVDLLVWLLGELHRGLGGSKKKSSIVYESFQGLVEVHALEKRRKKKAVKAELVSVRSA